MSNKILIAYYSHSGNIINAAKLKVEKWLRRLGLSLNPRAVEVVGVSDYFIRFTESPP